MNKSLRNASTQSREKNESSDGTYTSMPDAPTAPAWRMGSGLVAVKCPMCGGVHLYGDPTRPPGDRTRVVGCPEIFRQRAGSAINVDVRIERAPAWVALAFNRASPMGALADAARLIAGGSTISLARFLARKREDEHEGFWVPRRDDIQLALATLEKVGAFEAARELRRDLDLMLPRGMRRASATDLWLSATGRTMRGQLIQALADAYRGGAE